jgi:hypothetical protein
VVATEGNRSLERNRKLSSMSAFFQVQHQKTVHNKEGECKQVNSNLQASFQQTPTENNEVVDRHPKFSFTQTNTDCGQPGLTLLPPKVKPPEDPK